MPQRSNDFQKLLALVQRTFAPLGATVEESAMVSAPGIGPLREIDVLVTNAKTGPYKLKLAFEAKDHKRQLNVTDIEGIIGKYRSSGSLVVDKVFIVTRKGVSKAAKEKAGLNGIGILTLREIEEAGIPGFPMRNTKIEMNQRPHPAHVVLKLSNGICLTGKQLNSGCFVCKCHGSVKGTVAKYMKWVISNIPDHIKRLIDERLKRECNVCMPGELDLSGMRFKSTSGLNDVVSLAFHIHASRFSAPMTVSNYELVGDSMDPCRMQVATAEIAGAKVEITRPIGSPGVITFKMQSCGKDSGHKKK